METSPSPGGSVPGPAHASKRKMYDASLRSVLRLRYSQRLGQKRLLPGEMKPNALVGLSELATWFEPQTMACLTVLRTEGLFYPFAHVWGWEVGRKVVTREPSLLECDEDTGLKQSHPLLFKKKKIY